MISIAASKYFSVLVMEDGKVWTFGGGYNGELGHAASWQPQARPVEGFAAQVPQPLPCGSAAHVTRSLPCTVSHPPSHLHCQTHPLPSHGGSVAGLIACWLDFEEGSRPDT